MIRIRRNRWLVLSGCFVSMALVYGGGFETSMVFILPLVKHFKWSYTEVSTLNAALAIGVGLAAPVVGWLLDRIGAPVCMAVGAALTGFGLGFAAVGDSLMHMVASYFLIGAGMGFATLVPCYFVIANWFHSQRGVALGIIAAATSLAGMPMIMLGNHMILVSGWRSAYRILSIIVFFAIPVVLILVRSRPTVERLEASSTGYTATETAGLEVDEALSRSSFWFIFFATFTFWFIVTGWGIHSVPFLVSLGYSSTEAALGLSAVYILGTVGKLTVPPLADRFGARQVTAADLSLLGLGMLFLVFAHHVVMLLLCLIMAGLTAGAPMALFAMVQLESLGIRRFGTLSGLLSIAYTLGFSTGPLFAGKVFDATDSYRPAYFLFSVILFIASLAIFTCSPLRGFESASDFSQKALGNIPHQNVGGERGE
jgi:MFS family permease